MNTERNRSAAGWIVVVMSVLALAGPGVTVALAQSDVPHVEIYGFVQADYIQDFDRVDPAWEDTLRPSRIPGRAGR